MSRQNAPYQGSYKTDLSSIAALSFLVWDILITLDQEVDSIWSKPNRFYSKWLFLFVRYFAVAMQIALIFVGTQIALSFNYPESACVKWYVFQEVGTQLLIAAVESILIIRVHALYDRSRYVTLALVILFLLENIAMAITLIKVVAEVRFDVSCTVIHSPSSLAIFAAAFVLFETILFVLTLAKFLVALRSGWGHTPVVSLLIRDGTWAFTLIFVTLCINAGFFLGAGNTPSSAIAFPWLLSIESFAGARIILNLHTVSFDVSTDGFSTSGVGGTLSSHIVFTTHTSVDNRRPRTPSVRWDWGGLPGHSHDESTGRATESQSGTGVGATSESYEMTPTASTRDADTRKLSNKASTSATNSTGPRTCSDTCIINVEQDVV